MSIFRNLNQPESFNITEHPKFVQLSEKFQKSIQETYQNVYLNNQQKGIKIAQGIAYTTAKDLCEGLSNEASESGRETLLDLVRKHGSLAGAQAAMRTKNLTPIKAAEPVKEGELDEKHIGFSNLEGKLERKGYNKDSAGAIAHSIEVKKYGKKAAAKASRTHKPIEEADLDEKHIGFQNLEKKLERQGKSEQSAGAIAHYIEVKKYGKKAADRASRTHQPLGENEWEGATDNYPPGPYCGESEETGNTEFDNGASEVQDTNKDAKYCNKCGGVHAPEDSCISVGKDEEGAGSIQKQNLSIKGIKQSDPINGTKSIVDVSVSKPGPTYESKKTKLQVLDEDEPTFPEVLSKHGFKHDETDSEGHSTYSHSDGSKVHVSPTGEWKRKRGVNGNSGSSVKSLDRYLNSLKSSKKSAAKRKETDDLMRDLGLNKVKGSVSGKTYYESVESDTMDVLSESKNHPVKSSKHVSCKTCKGTGLMHGDRKDVCLTCHGSGKTWAVQKESVNIDPLISAALDFATNRKKNIEEGNVLSESKAQTLSRDPFTRVDHIKQHVGSGECGWCGQNKKLFKYGTESDSGKRNFSKGKFCSKSCYKSYHS